MLPARRRLLRLLAAALGWGGAGAAVRAGVVRSSAIGGQLRRAIPVSGEQLPVIGLGTARSFDVGMAAERRIPLREVVRAFVEQGGAVVDTSPMYGSVESVLGRVVAETGVSGRIFLATKVWTEGRDAGVRQMESSMRNLGTDVIDLMQVHNLVDTATHLKTMREWKARGRIRYLGITHYTSSAFGELERWMRNERPDFVQFPYSIANRAAEDRLLQVAAEHGVATIAHRNFERGRLFEKVKDRRLPDWTAEFECASWGNFFLKYLIADPRLGCVIPATGKRRHLLDNMNAGRGPLPDARQRRRMARMIDSL
jgi:diketogulonate reductase-like aldo/keto reductase